MDKHFGKKTNAIGKTYFNNNDKKYILYYVYNIKKNHWEFEFY